MIKVFKRRLQAGYLGLAILAGINASQLCADETELIQTNSKAVTNSVARVRQDLPNLLYLHGQANRGDV